MHRRSRWFIWRGNALLASAKGHEYFLKHKIQKKKTKQKVSQAKAKGKNGYLEFVPSMSQAHTDRIALERELHVALKRGGEFELYFQPQISFAERDSPGGPSESKRVLGRFCCRAIRLSKRLTQQHRRYYARFFLECK